MRHRLPWGAAAAITTMKSLTLWQLANSLREGNIQRELVQGFSSPRTSPESMAARVRVPARLVRKLLSLNATASFGRRPERPRTQALVRRTFGMTLPGGPLHVRARLGHDVPSQSPQQSPSRIQRCSSWYTSGYLMLQCSLLKMSMPTAAWPALLMCLERLPLPQKISRKKRLEGRRASASAARCISQRAATRAPGSPRFAALQTPDGEHSPSRGGRGIVKGPGG